MTLLNFTVTDLQAAIVTDTGVFDDDRVMGFKTKALAMPHLRLVVAAAGNTGVIVEWITWLLYGLPVKDVEDLDQEAPDFLRGAWERREGKGETMICHFGVTASDQIKAFKYCSENGWRSQIIPPGECWAMPAPLARQLEIEAAFRRLTSEPQHDRDVCYIPTWADRVGAIVDATQRQARDGNKVAGRVQVTFLTPESIHQVWLAELPRPIEVVE